MATPLLTTKLYIPPTRPELISRPRLIERLNAGLHRKLTLISAPAGFGKTTLLSQWASQQVSESANGRPVAWLSLDEDDNDPARFLAYLVAALQTIEGNVGQGLLAALKSPGAVNVEPLLTALLNEIAGLPDNPSTNSGRRFALVLDDYHVIESQPIDNALTFTLDHLPPQIHLVIASRSDPTLPLSRLRARGQLTELRAADLRFTTDEAAAFLKQVIRLPISSDDVRTLENRTEGWITGLQLAAVAMQGLEQRDQIARFIHSFGGRHRYVIDYLVDEVLDQQTLEVQEFLLQTSILDRMTAPLCNVVAGWEDSQAILERLEAANLFLAPLDGERRWDRYHHLFADLGKLGCILYLFAEAARRGRIAGGSRDSITCTGGRAALGFGIDFDASDELLDRYAATFSKGLRSARNQVAYRAQMEAARKSWRALYEYGERRHCSAELAKEWILHGLPRYDIPHEYVLFKPTSLTNPDENVRAVIFPVSPVELAGLGTLAGSVIPGTDPIQVPQGADCNSITSFAYAQADLAAPRAVLGMLGVDGREVMRKRFRDDTLTLTLPTPLLQRMEREADDCVFQTPSWKELLGG